MGLALLWVAPVSFAIVLLSRRLQVKLGKMHMEAKLALADGIQECLETVQDIKACDLEEEYLKKLDAKIDAAEKSQISSEAATASLVTAGQMLLRLGLATVIVVGNTLMLHGETTLFAYILFLIAASRLYDPLSAAMTNMAELFNVDLQVDRLKAIQNYPEEKGEKNYHTNGYDITFDHVGFSYEPGKPVLKDASPSPQGKDRSQRWSAPPAAERAPSPISPQAFMMWTAVGSRWAARTSPPSIQQP